MRRRHFFRRSLKAVSGLYGVGEALNSSLAWAGQKATQSIGGADRFRSLNQALDRGAMQRGWAREVDPDYRHASPEGVEAFKDLKFGIRIHWGLYSMIGSHESWALAGADQEFWNFYNILYQFFNPTDFDANAWMNLFERAGARFFTFTTKHHDGFCLWPTKTTQKSIRLTPGAFDRGVEHYETVENHYSIMDGPYKRDIVKALVEAGRRKGMGIGLYYSHVDWHDTSFAWDPFNVHYDPAFTQQSNPARWQRFIDQERNQVRELMSEYGKIDYLDFDIGWPEAAAKDIAEITKMVRRLQPNVIIRDRGIGAYGDYHTPEGTIPGKPTPGLWKVIYPCGAAFSYLPNDSYKPAEWIVESLVGTVAKGGNFEVGFGPMPTGAWPQETIERLEYVGQWLKINGEAIYHTRAREVVNEGDSLWYTSSKDGRFAYAISMKWPGERLRLRSVRAVAGSPITLLGVKRPLEWQQQADALVIQIPPQVAENKPCKQAFAFKIQAKAA